MFTHSNMMWSTLQEENDVLHENKESSPTIRLNVGPIKCSVLHETETTALHPLTDSGIAASEQSPQNRAEENNAIKPISMTCHDNQGFLFIVSP